MAPEKLQECVVNLRQSSQRHSIKFCQRLLHAWASEPRRCLSLTTTNEHRENESDSRNRRRWQGDDPSGLHAVELPIMTAEYLINPARLDFVDLRQTLMQIKSRLRRFAQN
jgi:hypothetical protein